MKTVKPLILMSDEELSKLSDTDILVGAFNGIQFIHNNLSRTDIIIITNVTQMEMYKDMHRIYTILDERDLNKEYNFLKIILGFYKNKKELLYI